MNMTPEQALQALAQLVRHPQLRILNTDETLAMINALEVLKKAIVQRVESEPE